MTVHAEIITGPLPPMSALPAAHSAEGRSCETGARVVFEGIVRATEDGKPLVALDYQTYEPMAQRQIEAIALELIRVHGLHDVIIRHSRGRVPVGACSFRLVVTSPHRAEALRAVAEFIDRLKQDVPIWKRVVWSAGA